MNDNKICNVRIALTLRRVSATTVVVEKQLSMTYCECVFVDLRIQDARLMRLIVVCGLPDSTTFFNISS